MHPVFQLEPPEPPPLPEHFSYSALSEIEACPRRWWLEHGRYRHVEGRYPQPVHPAAVFGSIVHGALDVFAEALRAAGTPQPGSAAFLDVRRSFPLRATIQRLRRERLAAHALNPRIDLPALAAQVSVDAGIGAFKSLVLQAYPYEAELAESGRTPPLQPPAPSTPVPQATTAFPWTRSASGQPARTLAIPYPAALPEVRLTVDEPPLHGLIDLVLTGVAGDTLVEFKTGTFKTEHELQSLMYAVLWWRSSGRWIRQRLLLYTEHDPVVLCGLTAEELQREADALRTRLAAARQVLAGRRPPAKPAATTCQFCPVRQLCNEYWRAAATAADRWQLTGGDWELPSGPAPERKDLEVDLRTAQDRGDGFAVDVLKPGGEPIQLLCAVPPKYYPGTIRAHQLVRLLNVGLYREGHRLRVVWARNSEAYWKPDARAVATPGSPLRGGRS